MISFIAIISGAVYCAAKHVIVTLILKEETLTNKMKAVGPAASFQSQNHLDGGAACVLF